jgi:aminoglycoside phosphotransferase family enzyme
MDPMHADDVSLEEKVRFLASARSYPDGTASVVAVETHMSWVFLTDRHAYKLKKPVRYTYLDFSSLAARRTFCEAEVRLNRRLAASVYLGTVALTRGQDGSLALGGEGEAVEWLVEMRRLRRETMLEERIRAGTLLPEEVDAVAARLAEFYRSLAPVPIPPREYVDRFAAEIAASHAELSRDAYALDAGRLEALRRSQVDALTALGARLGARGSRVVEGHGDLRAEHVWLEHPPVVIDCLEFDRELRLVDPLDDLGFLALECTRLGRPDIESRLLDAYVRSTQDAVDGALLRFYQSIRAVLRARLAIQHLREARFLGSDHWRERAQAYIELALGQCRSSGPAAVSTARRSAAPDPGRPR